MVFFVSGDAAAAVGEAGIILKRVTLVSVCGCLYVKIKRVQRVANSNDVFHGGYHWWMMDDEQ